MEKSFSYGGQSLTAHWNEKVYNGVRYITVSNAADRYGKDLKMTWSDERGWAKNGGMPYAQTVADLFGLK